MMAITTLRAELTRLGLISRVHVEISNLDHEVEPMTHASTDAWEGYEGRMACFASGPILYQWRAIGGGAEKSPLRYGYAVIVDTNKVYNARGDNSTWIRLISVG